MTVEAQADDAVFVPTGHPVRRAVVAIAGVVVLGLVTWMGGLVTPRFDAEPTTGTYNVLSGEGDTVVQLDNAAWAGIELEGAQLMAEGVETTGADLGDVPLGQHPRLSSGERQWLRVRFRVVGCPDVSARSNWRIAVTARTPLGLTRAVTVPMLSIGSDACLYLPRP